MPPVTNKAQQARAAKTAKQKLRRAEASAANQERQQEDQDLAVAASLATADTTADKDSILHTEELRVRRNARDRAAYHAKRPQPNPTLDPNCNPKEAPFKEAVPAGVLLVPGDDLPEEASPAEGLPRPSELPGMPHQLRRNAYQKR